MAKGNPFQPVTAVIRSHNQRMTNKLFIYLSVEKEMFFRPSYLTLSLSIYKKKLELEIIIA